MKRTLALVVLCLISASGAFAWNCPTGQHRVQAPAGTPTNSPYYDVVEGIAFICEPDKPTPSPSTPSTQNQNQSQQQTQNTSVSTTNSNQNSSASNSASKANSNSTSSSSSVSGSSSTSNASANNNGNGSNNSSYNNETNIRESQIPVSTAVGVAPSPTATCFKGYGGGVQTLPVGVSFGGGKIDENCAILETARSFDSAGEYLAGCLVKVSNKYAKKAGVTMDDCMAREKHVVPNPGSSVPVPSTPTIIVVPTPAPIAAVPEPRPIAIPAASLGVLVAGECKLFNDKLTNACFRVLDDFVIRLNNKPDSRLKIIGPIQSTQAVKYLKSHVTASRVEYVFSDDQNATVNFELWSAE